MLANHAGRFGLFVADAGPALVDPEPDRAERQLAAVCPIVQRLPGGVRTAFEEPSGNITPGGDDRIEMMMTEPVSLPVWLAAIAGAFALWAVLDRLLIPGARWFFRRRANRMINELNMRLELRIPTFQQTRRQVLIDQLTYDPIVMQAVEAQAETSNIPREALIGEVRRYAREIVPSFNAYTYFRIGYFLARRTVQFLYRLRLGYADDEALSVIDPGASVVFVMNHRSNMDYVIVAYMAAKRSALSYAVGEWARVWPLRMLIRSLGAYFVRRDSRNSLYRQVLSRYVQAATAGGIVQAVFPEGGLSRDGRLREPKLGLINYMVSSFDRDGERDLVFIPVGLNYDRVPEDRSLLRALDTNVAPRSKTFVIATFLKFVAHNVSLMLRRRWYRFGYACVNFGTPISMRCYTRRRNIDFRTLERGARREAVERLGSDLLEAISAAIPVLPVSLVATVFVRRIDAMSELEVKAEAQSLIDELTRRGAYVHIPRANHDYAVTVGLRMLTLRHLVEETEGLYRARDTERELLQYYANSIVHFLEDRSEQSA